MIIQVENGVVVGGFTGAFVLAELAAANPSFEFHEVDASGPVVGMTYSNGVLSGEPYPPPAPPVIDPVPAIKAAIVAATQKRLDDFAKSRNYDSILSACTYATSSVPKFQAEGQYCVDARDATWSALYTLMSEVEQGTTPMPSGFDEVEPRLPTLAWPV